MFNIMYQVIIYILIILLFILSYSAEVFSFCFVYNIDCTSNIFFLVYQRTAWGLSANLTVNSKHIKLERSLLSGLPNEVDFAINMCTLLSNEGRHVLQLSTCPRMLPLLLGHVGIFEEGLGSVYDVYAHSWAEYCKRNYFRVGISFKSFKTNKKI